MSEILILICFGCVGSGGNGLGLRRGRRSKLPREGWASSPEKPHVSATTGWRNCAGPEWRLEEHVIFLRAVPPY